VNPFFDSLPSETEEQRFEREQNENDVLDTLVDYKCNTGISVYSNSRARPAGSFFRWTTQVMYDPFFLCYILY
jgi:hypothetical protein